ncbi:hypothetical protein HK103_004395 [Boothiomyces macroporosus]|uniref:Thioredoxin domain-containing protein n=1 Tax=Boothiomyces macroporosus TaxID=261099 RepID=A0AAD5UGI6_9FUNG|nr:hypothetical protein HK103_004395 [Boothiomyces macroporosus]
MSFEEKTKTGVTLIYYYITIQPEPFTHSFGANVKYYEIDVDSVTEKLPITRENCPCLQWFVEGRPFETFFNVDVLKAKEIYEKIIDEMEFPKKYDYFVQSAEIRIAYFYAGWAKINQAVTERAKKMSNPNHVLFLNVDDHDCQDLANSLEIASFPWFRLYLNGKLLLETSEPNAAERMCEEYKKNGMVANAEIINRNKQSPKKGKTKNKGGRIMEVKGYKDYMEQLKNQLVIVYLHVKSNVEDDIKILDNLGFIHLDATFLMVDADKIENKEIVDLLQPDQYPFLRLHDKVNNEYIEVTLTTMRIILNEYKILQETRAKINRDKELYPQEVKHIEERFKSIPNLLKAGKSIPNLKYGIQASLSHIAGSSAKQSPVSLSSSSSRSSVVRGDRKLSRVQSDIPSKQEKKSVSAETQTKLVKVESSSRRHSSGVSVIEGTSI